MTSVVFSNSGRLVLLDFFRTNGFSEAFREEFVEKSKTAKMDRGSVAILCGYLVELLAVTPPPSESASSSGRTPVLMPPPKMVPENPRGSASVGSPTKRPRSSSGARALRSRVDICSDEDVYPDSIVTCSSEEVCIFAALQKKYDASKKPLMIPAHRKPRMTDCSVPDETMEDFGMTMLRRRFEYNHGPVLLVKIPKQLHECLEKIIQSKEGQRKHFLVDPIHFFREHCNPGINAQLKRLNVLMDDLGWKMGHSSRAEVVVYLAQCLDVCFHSALDEKIRRSEETCVFLRVG